MSSQESKRHRVADLLHAKVDPKTILSIVGVSLRTVYNVRKTMNSGNGIQRKSGRGGSNKKRNQEFLKTVKGKIARDPTTSMRKMAAEIQVDPKTVRTTVHNDLGHHWVALKLSLPILVVILNNKLLIK